MLVHIEAIIAFELTHLFLFIFLEKLTAQSNQCAIEHSGQLVANYEESKKSNDRPEDDTHHVLNDEHKNVDKNTENSQNKEVVPLQ
jgi:hypothetical protein